MITVESRPARFEAVQWHQPGDGAELGVQAYRFGGEVRHGLHTMTGMQRLTPGDWIVLHGVMNAQVYSPVEFHQKFQIIEEETS